MPQSLAKIYIHLIFSTKNHERLLPDEIRSELYSYIGGILNGLGCSPVEINTEPDHAHVLFIMSRTETLSNVVGQIKKSSNDWLRTRGSQFNNFYWQGGYGAFSVSQSAVEEVREYIRTQQEHHRRISFQEEFQAFLNVTRFSLMSAMSGIDVMTLQLYRPFRTDAFIVHWSQGIDTRSALKEREKCASLWRFQTRIRPETGRES